MKVTLNEICDAFDDLIHERKSRKQLSNWAFRREMAEDAHNLEYIPLEYEDKIWDAIKYLTRVDSLNIDGSYFFSIENIIDERNKLGLEKIQTMKNDSSQSQKAKNAIRGRSEIPMQMNKESVGKELKAELAKGFEIVRIARWALDAIHRFVGTTECDDEELVETLQRIARMKYSRKYKEDGLTPEEVLQLADQLIASGEKEELCDPIPEIKESAIPAKDSWLMCPLCKKAWESASKYAMVRCPKCNGKLHNPEYGALTDKS